MSDQKLARPSSVRTGIGSLSRRRLAIGLSFVVLLVVVGAGCTTQQRVNTETALAQALISDEQMAQVGEQVHAELEDQGVRYVTNPEVVRYVTGVATRIFDLARQDRSGVEYHVHVIDDPKTVNAFATPGGHIYIYSGTLLAAENEAEMAGVLAHETGHVAGRHVERAMVDAYGMQELAAIALGDDPSGAKQIAASLVGTGVMRAHSRGEESEADEYGVRYISALNYDPTAMITFFQKLQAAESGTSLTPGWLRTHPVTAERISDLKSYIAANNLGGSVLGAERYRAIKAKL